MDDAEREAAGSGTERLAALDEDGGGNRDWWEAAADRASSREVEADTEREGAAEASEGVEGGGTRTAEYQDTSSAEYDTTRGPASKRSHGKYRKPRMSESHDTEAGKWRVTTPRALN